MTRPAEPSPAFVDAVTRAVVARIVEGLEANATEKPRDSVDLLSMGLADRFRRIHERIDGG